VTLLEAGYDQRFYKDGNMMAIKADDPDILRAVPDADVIILKMSKVALAVHMHCIFLIGRI
jgi:hypothetical protein